MRCRLASAERAAGRSGYWAASHLYFNLCLDCGETPRITYYFVLCGQIYYMNVFAFNLIRTSYLINITHNHETSQLKVTVIKSFVI